MNDYDPPLTVILEGAILASGEPLTLARMKTLFEAESAPDDAAIEHALVEIKKSCEERGFDLVEVASGWRFQVRENIATWVNRLWEEKPQKYSRALLETLALIAYRQPITRGDIEEVRGVAVSSHIIKTLSERDWVKVVGHRDVPGRPSLYATTRAFLDYFNLRSLDELPTLGELKDIDSLNRHLALEPESVSEPQEKTPDTTPTQEDASSEDAKAEEIENSLNGLPDESIENSETSGGEASVDADEAHRVEETIQANSAISMDDALKEGGESVDSNEVVSLSQSVDEEEWEKDKNPAPRDEHKLNTPSLFSEIEASDDQ